ncbi:MAG TPA: trypsin-like peptidase domain-containing protein [Actinomycetota bacterium]|nr:trypsin-like peptidase domain-containing protein [Actinomycetota bacterium]
MTDKTSHRLLLPLIVGSALALAACTPPQTETTESPSPQQTSPTPQANVSTDPVVRVVDRVAPAVVNITTQVLEVDPLGAVQQGSGTGTGFIVREDGVIVTNFHVVEGATRIRVVLPPPNRDTFTARVIGGDEEHDLAVLKVPGDSLPTIPLGRSSTLQLGQRVVALGYALALEGGPTVTSGIISSLQRTIRIPDPQAGVTRTLQDALQTDAAINPGNSGGPLVDLNGNVVGINTAGAGQAENIGFSIAIDAAKPMIDRAMRRPAQPVAYLGVSTTTLDSGLAFQLGLPVDQGALVQAVTGPSEDAGIEPGDVIIAFEGERIITTEDLGRAILRRRPGDRVDVRIIRPDGESSTLRVELGVRPLPTP